MCVLSQLNQFEQTSDFKQLTIHVENYMYWTKYMY